MQTGNFENFSGTIEQIGPLYSFVGSEFALVIAAIVFWLGWHVVQLRQEKREYDQYSRAASKPDTASPDDAPPSD